MPRPANPLAREAILEAARAEFAHRGLEGARVADIARRAGVSKGAFYLHFASKDEAFREILQRFFGVMEEYAHRRHEAEQCFQRDVGRPGQGASLDEVVALDLQLDGELLDVLWRNRLILGALDRAVGQPYLEMVTAFRRRMRLTVETSIARKQEEGFLRRDIPPEVMGDVLVGAYESFGRRMAELRHKPDVRTWLQGFLRLVYQGLFAPATPAARPAAALGGGVPHRD